MKIRRLDVAADGTAEVLLLTQPIPRHISLVDWGANDAPAVSWKAANQQVASLILRSPPSGKVASASTVDGPTLRAFIGETLDAWMSCLDSVLSSALQPGDRSAQFRALTVQAGARIAAALTLLGPSAASAAAAHKSAGLKIPDVPAATTLQGELDRRRLRAAMEAASAYLMGASLDAAKLSVGATESVLSSFSSVADAFGSAVGQLPAGVVGATPTKRAAPIPHVPEIPMFTLAMFKTLLAEDPVGVIKALGAAVEAAKKSGTEGVSVAKKFMWGETGVDPYDPNAILSGLVSFQDGAALQALVAGAVAGIDVNKAVGSSMTVAATFRSFIASELRANPDGDLAAAIKAAIAPDVAAATVEIIRRAMDGGHLGSERGGMSFEPDDGTDIDLTPDLPGSIARV